MTKLRLVYVAIITTVLIVGTGLYFFYFWSPAPEWDKSPQAQIITIEEITESDYNYIPDVQVWGDGYIVWVEHSPDRSRKVMEGRISEPEIASLIQKLIRLDFFKIYRMNTDYCMGACLTVNLIDTIRIEPLRKENKQLYDFADYLKKGAEVNGQELVPVVGRFFAVPIEKSGYPANTRAQYHWPEDKFGDSLETLTGNSDGIKIIGDELKFAWEIVNSPTPTAESKGKVYWIYVVLPKVSPLLFVN